MILLLDTDDVAAGAAALYRKGVQLVVITLGAEGCCYYFYYGGCGHVSTYHINIVDTNGAGDAFTGAMLAKIRWIEGDLKRVRNFQMRDIMDFANAAGAACATKPGALLAAPTLDEVEIICRGRKQ